MLHHNARHHRETDEVHISMNPINLAIIKMIIIHRNPVFFCWKNCLWSSILFGLNLSENNMNYRK